MTNNSFHKNIKLHWIQVSRIVNWTLMKIARDPWNETGHELLLDCSLRLQKYLQVCCIHIFPQSKVKQSIGKPFLVDICFYKSTLVHSYSSHLCSTSYSISPQLLVLKFPHCSHCRALFPLLGLQQQSLAKHLLSAYQLTYTTYIALFMCHQSI